MPESPGQKALDAKPSRVTPQNTASVSLCEWPRGFREAAARFPASRGKDSSWPPKSKRYQAQPRR